MAISVDAPRLHAATPSGGHAPAPIEPDVTAPPADDAPQAARSESSAPAGNAKDGAVLLTTPADPVFPDPWVTLPNGNVVPAGQADPYYD
jgi:hypothetical protein